MTKLETVRALNDSGPQLLIVESVRELQKAVTLMHEDLKELPGAVASEVTQTLESVEQLRQDVAQQRQAVSELTAMQRRALDDLTEYQRQKMNEQAQRMGESAAATLGQEAKKLSVIVSEASHGQSEMKASIESMKPAAREMAKLPDWIKTAERDIYEAASKLRAAANEVRPSLWRQAAALILAGFIGAMLLATGQGIFERLVPPSDAQKAKEMVLLLWENATPKERELLNQIAARPAK